MVYTKTITEAYGGSVANATQNRMAVTAGLIYQFDLYLPPGSAGLLKVAVNDGGYRLYPSEPGEWFFGDNMLITFPDRYFVASDPTILTIWSYNEDEEYNHSFQIRIGQVSDPKLIQSFLPGLATENLAEEIARIVREQDTTREAQRQRILEGLREVQE